VPSAIHRVGLWLALLLTAAVGLQRLAVLQLSSPSQQGLDFPAPVDGADVPLLGVNVSLEQYGQADLYSVLSDLAESGFGWVRQTFCWEGIEPQPGRADWTWADSVVAAVAVHPPLRLVVVIDGCTPGSPSYPQAFAAFSGEFAARYGAMIDYYQIWDEPNLADHWGGSEANPTAYADLLARSASSIRSADPKALIVLAGLAPTVETGPQNLNEVLFLEQLYEAGAAEYFDVVAGKAYGFDTGPDDLRLDESVLNFSRLQLLRGVMVQHGDAGKALWASHWGWNALPPDWQGASSIWGQTDEAMQADWTVAGLERARLEWPWMGAMMLEHLQPAAGADDARWGFSLLTPEGEPRPVYEAVSSWAAAISDAAPPGGYAAASGRAEFGAGWTTGPIGADAGLDGSPAAFRFYGTAVAITVRRGAFPGFFYVTVDGEPAGELPIDESGRAYVVLYDSSPSLATVTLARGLSAGEHTVELLPEGTQGRWALVDWRVASEVPLESHAAGLALICGVTLLLGGLLLRDARRAEWAPLRGAFLAWPQWAQAVSILVSTALLWLAAGASWGRDWSSPVFVLSLPLVALTAALVFLRLDLGLAAVALTAPFYLHPGNLLYGAISIPELLVLLCLPAVVLRSRGRTWARSAPGLADLSVLLLVVAALVSGLAAADPRAALFELRTVFLLPSLYYFLLRIASLEDSGRNAVLGGLILGGLGVAMVGLVQYGLGRNLVVAEGGLSRLQSVYFSPNGAALYLGRIWPLLMATALWAERRLTRVLSAAGGAAVTLALVLTFSRGALLMAVPAAALVMGWRAGGRFRRGAIVAVLLLALALVPLLRVPRFASLLDFEAGSSFFRLELWRSSVAMIGDSPVLGVGPGNFLEAYRTRYVQPSAWQEINLGHPHNIVLDYLLRAGLLGLVAGIGVQVGFWRALRRTRSERVLALGLAGSMAALLAHGLVDNSLFYPDLALSFLALAALGQASLAGGSGPSPAITA